MEGYFFLMSLVLFIVSLTQTNRSAALERRIQFLEDEVRKLKMRK